MKSVLLDEHCTDLEKNPDALGEYADVFCVGKEIPTGSSDVECARYCIEKGCDFITSDKTAYDEFFKLDSVKSVQITRFRQGDDGKPPVFCVKIST